MLNKVTTLKGYKLDSLDGEFGSGEQFYFDVALGFELSERCFNDANIFSPAFDSALYSTK